jgi:hypothetical protein
MKAIDLYDLDLDIALRLGQALLKRADARTVRKLLGRQIRRRAFRAWAAFAHDPYGEDDRRLPRSGLWTVPLEDGFNHWYLTLTEGINADAVACAYEPDWVSGGIILNKPAAKVPVTCPECKALLKWAKRRWKQARKVK